jgi:hypothetical protein
MPISKGEKPSSLIFKKKLRALLDENNITVE